jgi:hypothetical protein
MPSFRQDTPTYAGCKYQPGKDPSLPPTKISSTDQEDQWDEEICEDQTKPHARAWSLIYVWINGFGFHFLPRNKPDFE